MESSQKRIEVMDGDYDMWSFACHCDVLLIDDLGKEHRTESGYASGLAERKLEDLLRARYDRKGVTFITTNLTAAAIKETYKKSTLSILKACTVKLLIAGQDLREEASEEAFESLSF